ncbi:MAG: hypothetical protein AAFR93_10030 [Pseudomonadota bacterium]
MSPLDCKDTQTLVCPRVTPIGSCRITNPLRMADAAGLVQLNTDGVYGYTHSSAEAVQMMRHMAGDLDIPELARPLVMPGGDAPAHGPAHDPSDLYLIELSSAKEVRMGTILVQLNYVTRHFAEFFADTTVTRAFWRLAKGDLEAEKRAFLQEVPSFRALSFEDQARLQLITQRPVDEATLREDIRILLDALPRAVFVTHCNARTRDGTTLTSRAAYIALAKRALSAEGAAFADPTELMDKVGQARALKDEAGSLSHYTEDFEAMLFDHWWRDLMAPALRRGTTHDTPLPAQGSPDPQQVATWMR